MMIEHCIDCGIPTGHPIIMDDSLYIEGAGPYCQECYKLECLAQGIEMENIIMVDSVDKNVKEKYMDIVKNAGTTLINEREKIVDMGLNFKTRGLIITISVLAGEVSTMSFDFETYIINDEGLLMVTKEGEYERD